MGRFLLILLFCLGAVLTACHHSPVSEAPRGLQQVDHIIVIYLENHSFYNLFARFPGAENPFPPGYQGQRDKSGQLYKVLPPVYTEEGKKKRKVLDKRFPKDLPNKEFLIDTYVSQDQKIPDPTHEFYTNQLQINKGTMDHFSAYSKVGGLTQGYYDMSHTALWEYASDYTLADHFFQSSFGGSFINHQWLIAARTPLFENAPASLKTVLAENGDVKTFNLLTTDGYAVNTVQPAHPPFDPEEKSLERRLPPLTHPTIGDLLSQKKIAWAWYAGGWNEAQLGHPRSDFQFHHQPFLYYQNYAPDTQGRLEHLRDEKDFFTDIKNKTLPQVVFVKPVGDENAHPGYSALGAADDKLRSLVEAVQKSPYWDHSLIIITFDEYGGFWDPVMPPTVDRWGPGSRIPAVFVSPLVKKHFVDHVPAETVSILALIENRFSLSALTERDAHAPKMFEIFAESTRRR